MRASPDVLVAAVVQSAASDWAAARLAVAIERVAVALLAEDEPAPQNDLGTIQTRTQDRLRLIHTERFQSSAPDSRAPRTLADCDSDGRQSPAEGTEPRGRVNSLSVGVCLV
jgi:hypothetical protein